MNEHMLSATGAYIKDFAEWYFKNENPPDIMVFINDRFFECSEDKKKVLSEIFIKLSTTISSDGTWSQDTIDIANSLVKIL